MDREVVREIARLGGEAVQRLGKGHTWTSEEAARAGRRGALAGHAKKRAAKLREIAIAAGNIGRNE